MLKVTPNSENNLQNCLLLSRYLIEGFLPQYFTNILNADQLRSCGEFVMAFAITLPSSVSRLRDWRRVFPAANDLTGSKLVGMGDFQ